MRSPPRNEADGGCIFPSIAICIGVLQTSSIVDVAGAEMFEQILSCKFHIKVDRAIFGVTCDWLTSSRVDKQIKQEEKSDFEFGCNVCFHLYLAVNDLSFNNWLVHFVVIKYDLLCLFV